MSSPEQNEAERRRLLAETEAHIARALDAKKRSDAHYARGPRWDLIGLILLGLAALGGAVYAVTGSAGWAAFTVLVGVPLTVLAGVVIYAFVAEALSKREAQTQRTLGATRVVVDRSAMRVLVAPGLAPDALALWVCAWVDYCIVRYNASAWDPSNPGARGVDALGRWLDAVEPQARADASHIAWPSGAPWRVVTETFVQPMGASDVSSTLLVGRSGVELRAGEVVGDFGRGDALNETLPAVLSHCGPALGAELAGVLSALRAQHAAYVAKGNGGRRGAVVRAALAGVPSLAGRAKA